MPNRIVGELNPPERVLLGAGPSSVSSRVLRALATPIVGHLDPYFLSVMDDTVHLLRELFKTANQLTIPISGTGSAGLEAALCNLLEPGDTIVIGVKGVFGERMADVAARYGARVLTVNGEWGRPLEPERFEKLLKHEARVRMVALVHAETSTGVLQPVEEIGRLAHQHEALFLLDTVTSLGGLEVQADGWGIDVCHSATQKCIGAPPGLSPITLSPQAVQVLRSRKSKVTNWYLDLTMLEKYWGKDRTYHHTAPVSMVFALREALRVIHEEGLEPRFARHRRNAEGLWAGLEALGLELLVAEPYRSVPLTTVRVPERVKDLEVRRPLLDEFNVEIGGGLGPLQGKIWRIGLMGHGSSPKNVFSLLTALEQILPRHGFEVAKGAALAAAERVLAE